MSTRRSIVIAAAAALAVLLAGCTSPSAGDHSSSAAAPPSSPAPSSAATETAATGDLAIDGLNASATGSDWAPTTRDTVASISPQGTTFDPSLCAFITALPLWPQLVAQPASESSSVYENTAASTSQVAAVMVDAYDAGVDNSDTLTSVHQVPRTCQKFSITDRDITGTVQNLTVPDLGDASTGIAITATSRGVTVVLLVDLIIQGDTFITVLESTQLTKGDPTPSSRPLATLAALAVEHPELFAAN